MQTPFPVEYRLCWVPGVGSLRWACTFHVLGDANSTRRKPGFWWNMGLSPNVGLTNGVEFTNGPQIVL